MLPNFIIIGAQKAGTTSLWHYLKRHPSIFLATPKETDFFIEEKTHPKGLAWYESLFEKAPLEGATAVGEASPNYTAHPTYLGVPERIFRTIPSVRLIYLMRDPVARIRSSYIHERAAGRESLPIDEAVRTRPHYLHWSLYSRQIQQYLRYFDRSQLLLLLTEDLKLSRGETLDRVLTFLDLPAGWRPDNLAAERHRGADKRIPRWWARKLGGLLIRSKRRLPISERFFRRSPLAARRPTPADTIVSSETLRWLEDTLRPDVESLRENLGGEFDGWGLIE